MKKLFLFYFLFISVATSFAQEETLDISTYTAPQGWEKQPSESAVQFSKEDAATGTYCLITLYKSVPGTASSKENFDLAWTSIVKEMVTVSSAPEMQPAAIEDGWEAQSGYAPFEGEGSKGIVVLVTSSRFQKMVNIVILTNTDVYEKDMTAFLESVSFQKSVAAQTQDVIETPQAETTNGQTNTSVQLADNEPQNNSNTNTEAPAAAVKGGFAFDTTQKETFDIINFTVPQGWDKKPSEKAIQFSKEDATKGTYCLITLYSSLPGKGNPKENFDLAWSTLIKESVTVSTDPEMQAPANEDGWEAQSGYAPFESEGSKGIAVLVTSSGFQKMVNIVILTNTDEYEKDMTAFLESVSFQKPVAAQTQDVIETQQPDTTNGQTNTSVQLADNEQQNNSNTNNQAPTAAVTSGFAFTTTNFDDGWTSIVKEDWVEVTKANIKVLIHYPNKNADAYNSVLLDGLKNAWDILIAPKYSSATNMEFKSYGSWESIEFSEADMVENTTGKTVHVVFFKKNFRSGNGKYVEFITPDKNSFEQEFGTYENASANFGTGSGSDKMVNMATYNKFAVAASDLTGKWTNDFSGAIQYVNAATGFDAHMATHASVENFQIGPGTSYKWDLGVASGNVGNIKFQSVKSSGKFSMIGNWQVNFSDIEGKPRTYNAHFTCIKGLRILWLNDRAFAKKE